MNRSSLNIIQNIPLNNVQITPIQINNPLVSLVPINKLIGYTYFNYIPYELIEIIMLYMPSFTSKEVNYLKFQTAFPEIKYIKDILNSKIFWINRLKDEKLDEYIPFLGHNNNYIEDYKQFVNIKNNVNTIISECDQIFFPQLAFRIKENININELITTLDLKNFKNMIPDLRSEPKHIVIFRKIGNDYNYLYLHGSNKIYSKDITIDNFILVLIKLYLLNYDVLSNGSSGIFMLSHPDEPVNYRNENDEIDRNY